MAHLIFNINTLHGAQKTLTGQPWPTATKNIRPVYFPMVIGSALRKELLTLALFIWRKKAARAGNKHHRKISW